jgi:hypothetical protein
MVMHIDGGEDQSWSGWPGSGALREPISGVYSSGRTTCWACTLAGSMTNRRLAGEGLQRETGAVLGSRKGPKMDCGLGLTHVKPVFGAGRARPDAPFGPTQARTVGFLAPARRLRYQAVDFVHFSISVSVSISIHSTVVALSVSVSP